ncbi:MAG: cadmium-translocating P-type ATPase [Gammaproteobacteria bacterium]|nr:MAG: cadmium-translocating P-type ATPase [Gammaproteobacteria bacterium]
MFSVETAIDDRSRTDAGEAGSVCFHCGLPVPDDLDLQVTINKRQEPMCCHGCQAVAQAIIDAGLADFYRYRTENPLTGREVVPDIIRQNRVYDHPDVQKQFVRVEPGNIREAALFLEGITCAACIWLNERHLTQLPGILEVQINYATHRARVRWDAARIKLSEILEAIQSIGYAAHPYDPLHQQQAFDRLRRKHLQRLGVAAVLGMQVMLLSIALYIGDWSGMEAGFRHLFRWLGLALTLPVLLYSAVPFFQGALRDLRNHRIGMDVPVTLGILVAFLGSLHATWSGRGDVYYDSVVMFVFLLLLSRYFEIMARKRGAEMAEQLTHALPAMATRLTGTDPGEPHELVPVTELVPGDRVLVKPGETVPVDGRIVTGQSSVNEALLTGESTPLSRQPGDELIGGSINIESPLTIVVSRIGPDTVLAGILRLMEQAQAEKPAITRLADRVASWFVGGVLLVAVLSGLYWWQHAPDDWLPIVVAVLVITCPCALSLATPTALSAAAGTLLSHGLLPARGNRLETLARCTHVVFDKTGTLTRGTPVVTGLRCCSELDGAEILKIAAALESASEHPLGTAIRSMAAGLPLPTVSELSNHPGAGVSGMIENTTYFIGSPDFVASQTEADLALLQAEPAQTGTRIAIADSHTLHALLILHDEIRPDAQAAIATLRNQGLQVQLMTGDHAHAARQVADLVGIDSVQAAMQPVDKLHAVRDLQQRGAVVAMVGDGINDAPVLAAANVSVAMQGAAHVTQASADLVLLTERLNSLPDGIFLARKTLGIIRQNLGWAVGYNLLALPAAVLGFVAPWMAAIGMSSSSLLVVLNALRLTRHKPATRPARN